MKHKNYVLLYARDINKVIAEINGYPDDDALWVKIPGTINPAGNIAQHLIGNLKTYIGNPFGHIHYVRNREAEFNARLFTQSQLVSELTALVDIISTALAAIPDKEMDEDYPQEIMKLFPDQTIDLILMHLLAHLSYHTGQINYHRRISLGRWT